MHFLCKESFVGSTLQLQIVGSTVSCALCTVQLQIVGSTLQLQVVGRTVQRVISVPQTTLNSTCLRKVCIVYYVQVYVEGQVCASSASDNEHS